MRRSWLGLAAAGAVGAAVIGVGVSSAGGATQATAGKTAAPARQAPAPPLPRAAVRAHTAGISRMYLKIQGAPGDVVDPGYHGAIQIFSFSVGVSFTPSTPGTGGGVGGGKASWSSLSLQAQLDRGTPELESFASKGQHAPYAVLTAVTPSGPAYRMVLGDVFVSSVSVGGAAGGGLPSVSYTLDYAREETDDYDNGQIIKSCWDQTTNTATCPTIPPSS